MDAGSSRRSYATVAPASREVNYRVRSNVWVDGRLTGRQTHAAWSEIDRAIMFDEVESESFLTLRAAKKHYAERRMSLAARGFIYSDMDPII